ncbi:oligopeptide transporter 3 [Tanacetum coccineum]
MHVMVMLVRPSAPKLSCVHIGILESTQENIVALLTGLEYLLSISYVDDTEVFKVLISTEIWSKCALGQFVSRDKFFQSRKYSLDVVSSLTLEQMHVRPLLLHKEYQLISIGHHGLGVSASTLDWVGIFAYHASPLVTSWTSIVSVRVGFIMFTHIIVPVCYWKYNTFDAHKFPIFSNKLFTRTGHEYDTTRILNPHFDLNEAAYDSYGNLYLSPLFALSIGSGFARFTATLTHVALFHGGDIWKHSKSAVHNVKLDIHTKLTKSYKQVPQWWYPVLLFGSIILSLVMCFVWKQDAQLPWWGFLFAFALAFIVTLPIGVIEAITNQQPGYDIIAQFIFGYMLPGKPIANLLFKIYGRISTVHALSFLSDLKLDHY